MDHAYQRIADDLRRKITSGELAEGDKLPSIPALMRTHGVTNGTAQSAIRTLVAEGLVATRPGSGTRVRPRPQLRALTRCWDRARRAGSPFAAEMEAQGRRGSWDYDSSTTQAPAEIRERLGLDDPERDVPDTLRTIYTYRADDDPVMLATSWEPLRLTRGTAIVLPEEGPHAGRGVVERMLAIGVRIDGTDEIVGARLGTADECQRLEKPPGSVMLTIKRTYVSDQEGAVETASIVMPADLFELVYGWRIDPPDDQE
ncbi:GntR family transcriptional regulator [Herbidospora daliensis]|uniref:GntR family transcriptional regulator n=1 Tax=Herbidospora daliensis TaxID=295585 RepID=UPI0007848EC1|nr:GntR family transcriptional regulator [Herbidospora daliensis]